MDYERYYSYSNTRTLIIIVLLVFGINYYFHPMDMIFKPVPVNTTPVNNTIVIYKNITVTVTVTPTIDGKTYFAGEYENGIRKLGRYFSWLQKDVQGNSSMSGHVKVYDTRQFDSLHIYNPADAKYYEVRPSTDDKQYYFIFVKIYLDDIIGDANQLWVPNEQHYYLQSKGVVYKPIEWEKQLRIKELEYAVNDNKDYRIEYYGVFNAYSRDLRYRETAGEYAQEIYWNIGGESNAIDGYIIYEIPKGSKPDENIVLSDMYAFGNPSWVMVR